MAQIVINLCCDFRRIVSAESDVMKANDVIDDSLQELPLNNVAPFAVNLDCHCLIKVIPGMR